MYLGPNRLNYQNPERALGASLHNMRKEVEEYGCSEKVRVPINREILQAYKSIGESPRLSEVIPYDPLEVIPSAIATVFKGMAIKRYDRVFEPGESEGTHTDPHDIVVTYTQTGDALFTIAAQPPRNTHILGRHQLVMFNGRLPHEVSAPLGKSFRTITAFAIDFS